MLLLDTNVGVCILRNSSPEVSSRFQVVAPTGEVRVCSIVVAELLYGALRSAKPSANRTAVDGLLRPFPSLPFDDSAAELFADVRHKLATLEQPIGPYDLQIAAVALAHGCTLVTHNTSEFSRIVGLPLVDWQAA